MSMCRISLLTLWIYVSHIMGKGKWSEDNVFVNAGCSVTLEWELGNTSFMDHLTIIEILNASGFRIAWIEDDSCEKAEDISLRCEIRNRGDYWSISVALFHVTTSNSGRYTCRIKYGLEAETNFIKELIVIVGDKECSLPENNEGRQQKIIWMALVIVSVLILIIGSLIICAIWRGNTSRGFDPNKSRQEIIGPNHHEKTSTINEDSLSIHNHAEDSIIEHNSHEIGGTTGQECYDYASSVQTCQAETTDVQLIYDASTSFMNHPAHSIQAYHVEEGYQHVTEKKDMQGTNENYITPINDFAHPIALCQGKKTYVNEANQSYVNQCL